MITEATSFARRYYSVDITSLSLSQISGGLESGGTARATVHYTAGARANRSLFVIKQLGASSRELHAYLTMDKACLRGVAPELLGWSGNGSEWLLFLEWVNARQTWPWRQVGEATLVLERLARVHEVTAAAVSEPLSTWYERDLLSSADETAQAIEWASPEYLPWSTRRKRLVSRIVERLPKIREELRAFFQPVLLHGDAHPGNAKIRQSRSGAQAVLLDWGRARVGSPLEDVSSWLECLGYWEIEARRRHDTLLQNYLAARGMSTTLTAPLREQYWLAAACNALSGALRYHLAIMSDPKHTPLRRQRASKAARDWLRILRRADAVMRA